MTKERSNNLVVIGLDDGPREQKHIIVVKISTDKKAENFCEAAKTFGTHTIFYTDFYGRAPTNETAFQGFIEERHLIGIIECEKSVNKTLSRIYQKLNTCDG